MTSSSPYKPSLGLRRTAPFQQDGTVPLPGLMLCSQPGPTSPTVWSRQLPGPEPEARVQPRGQQSPAPLEGGKWGAGSLGQSQVLGAGARYQASLVLKHVVSAPTKSHRCVSRWEERPLLWAWGPVCPVPRLVAFRNLSLASRAGSVVAWVLGFPPACVRLASGSLRGGDHVSIHIEMDCPQQPWLTWSERVRSGLAG